MSWSIQKTIGTADKVREAVTSEFDREAKRYVGHREEQDVLDAKAAVVAFLSEFSGAPGWGVCVEASGSRGSSWATITVSCTTVRLLV